MDKSLHFTQPLNIPVSNLMPEKRNGRKYRSGTILNSKWYIVISSNWSLDLTNYNGTTYKYGQTHQSRKKIFMKY